MKLLRDNEGRVCGLGIRGVQILVLRRPKFEGWRLCDNCTLKEAIVFCETHVKYVCDECLHWHGRKSYGGEFVLGYACRLINKSWAQQIARVKQHGSVDDRRPVKQSEPSTFDSGMSGYVRTRPPGVVQSEPSDAKLKT